MKKTASLLVVLAAFFTMSSAFSAETPKFGADRHVARGMACASCHGPDGKSPEYPDQETCLKCHQKEDRKSTRLNSSHPLSSRMPSSA